MDVTSNHLDVVIPTWIQYEGEAGEELTKRGDQFGHPVGKGAYCIATRYPLTN